MYKLLLCLRYLRTRYIALACIVSVTLGVATMIVVNSVMAGFSTEMRDRIHGLLADIVLETRNLDGQPDAERHMELIREIAGEHVAGMTATVEIYGMLSFNYGNDWVTRPITLIGIEPEGKAQVGPLREYLDSFSPRRVGGEVVRPPLRDANAPLDWSLTDEARERRIRTAEFREPLNRNVGAAAPAPEIVTVGATEPVGDETAEPDEFDPALFEDEDPAAEMPPAIAVPDPTQLFNDDADAAVDPAEPLRGRLYIGEGLIAFPHEDPTTGQIKPYFMVQPGDDVKISTVAAGRPPNPVHFNATVVDVFKSGMSEYDASLVFCNLDYLQEVRGMIAPGTGTRSISRIQIKLTDYAHADEVVRKLRATFPPALYSVQTWEQKQGPLLSAVEVESAILNVLLFLIIAVAGFGILAIFFMIVVEKTRDIGILKALGAGSGGVLSIFLGYGLALGIVGAGVGVALGLTFVYYINEIEAILSMITGRKVFDESIYYFTSIPTSVSPTMVLWVAAGAMAIAVLASVLPARRAARLRPVEALRFE